MNFVNPYTFISLGENCVRRERKGDNTTGELFTGVISCKLETLTPLIIPNAANEHAFPGVERSIINTWNTSNPDPDKQAEPGEHKSYDFYSFEDPKGDRSAVYSRPIIPGSSLRGMIRGAFEAVTDSCLSTVDEEMTLHRRSPEAYKKCGIIEDGVLYPAEKVLIHTDAAWHSSYTSAPRFNRSGTASAPKLKTGCELWVTRSADAFSSSRGFSTGNKWVTSINAAGTGEKGVFLAGEQFGTGNKKHFDAVMIKKNNARAIYRLTQNDKNRLLELWTLYQENRSPSYAGWIKTDPMPVYYDDVDGKYYISPACISQEILHRKLGNLLGNFKPCQNANNPCEACSLFGMVAEEKGDQMDQRLLAADLSSAPDKKHGSALSSRVSFLDALPYEYSTPDEWFIEAPQTLPILGVPHITSSEFYQIDPDKSADYYNFDYKVTNQVKASLSDSEAKIRGRKFYWHSNPRLADLGKDKPNQNHTFRAVSDGRMFTFDVRFERLTASEIAKLIWVLEIGGDRDKAHKLGHGKPAGFGSVRISVDIHKSKVFSLDDSLTITETPMPTLPEVNDLDLKHSEEFLKVTEYAKHPNNVGYPIGKGRGEPTIYDWFGLNRQGGVTKRDTRDQNRATIFNTLPNLLDESQELPQYAPRGNEPLSVQYTSNRVPESQNRSPAKQLRQAQERIRTTLSVGSVVNGRVLSINLAADGTPKSADIDLGANQIPGIVNKANLEKTPLSIGEDRNFTVTLLRDDGKANLKPC